MVYNPRMNSPAQESLKAHRALGDWTRVALLTRLREAAVPLDARELAAATGIHVNTVRFHLDVLAKAQLVSSEFEHRPRRGRPRQIWRARALVAGPEAGYRMLAEVLTGYLQGSIPDPEGLGLEIGTAWGSQVAGSLPSSEQPGLTRVLDMLATLGFSPEKVDGLGETQIHLHSCPFLEVARTNRQLVCSTHLGLLRGALAEAGVPMVATHLDPLVEPALCIAHLEAEGLAAPEPVAHG